MALQTCAKDTNILRSRQWPEVYDLCHTFLHVALVKKPTAMRESHVIARDSRMQKRKNVRQNLIPRATAYSSYAVRGGSPYGSSYCCCNSAVYKVLKIALLPQRFEGTVDFAESILHMVRAIFAQLGHALNEYSRPVMQFNCLGYGIFAHPEDAWRPEAAALKRQKTTRGQCCSRAARGGWRSRAGRDGPISHSSVHMVKQAASLDLREAQGVRFGHHDGELIGTCRVHVDVAGFGGPEN